VAMAPCWLGHGAAPAEHRQGTGSSMALTRHRAGLNRYTILICLVIPQPESHPLLAHGEPPHGQAKAGAQKRAAKRSQPGTSRQPPGNPQVEGRHITGPAHQHPLLACRLPGPHLAPATPVSGMPVACPWLATGI
jgi:hypothetical protein